MIVGKQFVYFHIGKTGGDAMRVYASVVPQYVTLIVPHESVFKHGTPTDYGIVNTEWYVYSFRRLSSWYMSVVEHLRRHSSARAGHGIPDGTDIDIRLCYGSGLLSGHADKSLRMFLYGVDPRKVRWIRQESLLWDFVKFLESIYGPLPQQTISDLHAATEHTRSHDYVHEPSLFGGSHEIAELYLENPIWASVEKRLYDRQGSYGYGFAWSEVDPIWRDGGSAGMVRGAFPHFTDADGNWPVRPVCPDEPKHVEGDDVARAALADSPADGQVGASAEREDVRLAAGCQAVFGDVRQGTDRAYD